MELESAMYRIYKAQRNFIKLARHEKMNYDEFLYLQHIYESVERYDQKNNHFYDKWINEQEDI